MVPVPAWAAWICDSWPTGRLAPGQPGACRNLPQECREPRFGGAFFLGGRVWAVSLGLRSVIREPRAPSAALRDSPNDPPLVPPKAGRRAPARLSFGGRYR